MMDHYYLDGHVARPCPDLITWAMWFEKADRVVKQERIGGALVSTVFLGLNHQWGRGPPLLFETMIFGGRYESGEYCDRCSTWEQAEAMHARAVNLVRETITTKSETNDAA